jgi:hypothetical protein
MKLRELVYDCIQAARDFSDNSFIQDNYVEHLINTFRAKYLHQAYVRKPVLEPVNRQSLVFEMELVNSSIVPDIIETKRRILRTKDPVPRFLQLGRKPAIHSIGTIDRNEIGEFELVDKRRAQYMLHSPFCGAVAYVDTDYRIYFITAKESFGFLKNIVVDAVYEDPREAIYYMYPDEDEADEALNIIEYPVDMGLWSNIRAEVVGEMLRQVATPLDLQNQSAALNINPTPQPGAAAVQPNQ